MSQTDALPAKCFFADLILPLKHANTRKNVRYLSRTGKKASYWEGVVSRTGGLEKLSATSCDASALLELLGRYWASQSDRDLSKLLPYLIELRRGIVESSPVEDKQEAGLTEFVYPIF